MLGDTVPWLADALVILGVIIMTIGVYGVFRMPDVFTQLHAASKAVVLGAISFCLASVVTGEAAIVARVALIAILLLLTTPVASHVIGRGAYLEERRREDGKSTPSSEDGAAPARRGEFGRLER